ncbi:MAG: TolC family outer membrane protein [Sulfuricella sp.]|nr:TolC family outer membrane protein [Sulfuricella sp.]
MKRISLAVLALFAIPGLHAANLVDIHSEALSQDATFASARAAYQAGLEKLPQGKSQLLPNVTLGATATGNDVDSPTVRRQFSSQGYSLNLTQPVYRKQNLLQYDQAKGQVNIAEAQFAVARQDLMIRVAQAYFDVLLGQDNLALTGAQKAAIAEQLEQAKRNFEVGTSTITDTHEAQARFDLASAQEIVARNDLEIKKRALLQIIGRIPESLASLGAKLPLAYPEPNDMTKWVDAAEQQNLQLLIQREALQISNLEVERNRAGHLPTLDLVASYSSSNNPSYLFSGTTTSGSIGVQFNLPLYQGGLVDSKIREALANQDKARQDLEVARRQVMLQSNQAFLGVTNGIAQVKALEQALVSSQSSLESTRIGQEVGVRTSVDVLNAQQQLYSAKRDLSQARYNTILSQLKLKLATGVLSEQDLQQVNQWLK